MEKKRIKDTIRADGIEIKIYTDNFQDEFLSLTDIARYKSDEPNSVIANWLRNKDTIEFLGLWESLYNTEFKPLEYEWFKNKAGSNYFTLSPQKWITTTNAKGIASKSGRYGGTFAHSDIAFEFASWISPRFKLYIIKDYKRLKADESSKLSLNWNLNREISKLNYKFQTEAIKNNLIPSHLTKQQIAMKYASEADVLNIALFGMTAKEWQELYPKESGNIRDKATLNQLLVLANMESYNTILIENKKPQKDRLRLLNALAIRQLEILENINTDY